MQNTERQSEEPKFYSYTQVQSPEEGLYRALTDYAEGRLTGDDLRSMADMYCNSFPPFEFFQHRSGTEEYIREQGGKAKSPSEFAQTELFQDIMRDPIVVDRFQKASPNVFGLTGNNDYPPYWPQEYRLSPEERITALYQQDIEAAQYKEGHETAWSAPIAPEVKSWRTKLKDLLRWN